MYEVVLHPTLDDAYIVRDFATRRQVGPTFTFRAEAEALAGRLQCDEDREIDRRRYYAHALDPYYV